MAWKIEGISDDCEFALDECDDPRCNHPSVVIKTRTEQWIFPTCSEEICPIKVEKNE